MDKLVDYISKEEGVYMGSSFFFWINKCWTYYIEFMDFYIRYNLYCDKV